MSFATTVCLILWSFNLNPSFYNNSRIFITFLDLGLVPMLAKLVLLSSGIHQVIASFRMTLPFIIVQVQDSGLIFLSAIATSLGFLIKSNFYSGNLTPEGMPSAPPLTSYRFSPDIPITCLQL